jgi:hypothetical protein
MPNKKQKQAMKAEKKRRALTAKAVTESAAREFEERRMSEIARQADLRGEPPVFEKIPVKTRKALVLSPRLRSTLKRGDVLD